MENLMQCLDETVSYLKKEYEHDVTVGVILGSGLGAFPEKLINTKEISYEKIPHFPVSTVQGHAGKLIFGEVGGKKVVVMSGRFHFYEGYELSQVIFPVRVMGKLGIKNLIVSNAAGGINTSFEPGDLMLIDDHINMLGKNPLMGPNIDELGPRFPDMKAYTPALKDIVMKIGEENGFTLKRGVYLATTGPSYETPAEIKMMRVMGADAVGMSTVPEVITARHMGIKVVGISCITNMAAGILDQTLGHEEVFETAEKAKPKFTKLVEETIKAL